MLKIQNSSNLISNHLTVLFRLLKLTDSNCLPSDPYSYSYS